MSAAGESRLCIVSQHLREGQRIAKLEAEFEALQRQALAVGAAVGAALVWVPVAIYFLW